MRIKRTAKNFAEAGIPRGLQEIDSIEIIVEPDGKGRHKPVYLNTLRGCPRHIIGNMMISDAPISSLRGGPVTIGQTFAIDGTDVTSLKFGPTKVGKLLISYTNIGSLENCPRLSALQAVECRKLTSLKHCPDGASIHVVRCPITSLADGPKTAVLYDVVDCEITSLADITSIECKWFDVNSNPLHTLDGLERIKAKNSIIISLTSEFKGSILRSKFVKSRLVLCDKNSMENSNYELNDLAIHAFAHRDKSLFRAKLAMVQAGAKQYANL